MTPTELNYARDDMRRAVLDTLDQFVKEKFKNTPKAKRYGAWGWKDSDLDHLFPALDEQFARLVERFSVNED